MAEEMLPIDLILGILAGTPSRLAGLGQGVPAALLVAAPRAGEWPVREVLAHLRSC